MTKKILTKIKKLDHWDDSLELPTYKTSLDSGADIRACFPNKEDLVLKPGEKTLIPTGISMDIPLGYEIQVRPRSGIAAKTGLMILNSPGTVDNGYKGEIKIIMGNLGASPEVIKHGDRVAQIVLSPVIQMEIQITDNIGDSDRGEGGFGSTGRD